MPVRFFSPVTAARRFGKSERAAISAMYAVAILPLVVMAGVAFDYGRMMGLDSELQNAADQAALAAATQLDGSTAAIANSQAAAANALGNQTRFANDGGGRAIPTAGLTFVYFEGYKNDAPFGQTTDPVKAKVVLVNVENRAVRYALTPVMAAFSGGIARGSAMATMESATCNVPPLMFCQPYKSGSTTDIDTAFPTLADVGKGLKLHFKSNAGSAPGKTDGTGESEVWAPGNFGFLDLAYPSSAGNPNQTLGLNDSFVGCTGEGVKSDPGFRTPEGDALNTRMDIYGSPPKNCDGSGNFCPSVNSRKNFVVVANNKLNLDKAAGTCSPKPAGGGGGGGGNGNGGGNGGGGNSNDFPFTELPSSLAANDPGYPQDNCFSALIGGCNVVGNNNDDWGSSAWMNRIHNGTVISAVPDLDGNGRITRYEVYKWEMADPATRLKGTYVGTDGTKDYCSLPAASNQPPGLTESATSGQKDRRVLTVAAVDCSREADSSSPLTGKGKPYIVKWVDLFFVQPVNLTGSNRDFFTEIKGVATLAGGQSAFQNYSRKKAVLLR